MLRREGWRVAHQGIGTLGRCESLHESQRESDYGEEMNPVLGYEPPSKLMLSAIALVMH